MQYLFRAALAGLLLMSGSASAWALPTSWVIDSAHAGVHFSVRHMMISNVKGEFGRVTGTLTYDAAEPKKAIVEATIDVSTINTRVEKRDTHLKSAEFFDVAKYPSMTFKSTKVEVAGRGKLRVTGDLTLHGVTKAVKLDVQGPTASVKDPMGNEHIAIAATTRINRKDFGLTWNKALEAGGVVVGEEVAISLDIEFIKAPAP